MAKTYNAKQINPQNIAQLVCSEIFHCTVRSDRRRLVGENLLDDLVPLEVPREPSLARGAERAAQGAADLQ
jgi:hypothetical protein